MTALVCFTMDNLSDAADLGRGLISQPRQPGNRPALERGFPALLELYARYDIKITHFVEGWNGEAHPQELQELLRQGHELGMHGWQHEDWKTLTATQARDLAERATAALERASGTRPRAFRAPGGARSSATAQILSDLGYRIDASLGPGGDDAGAVSQLTPTLWTVPYEWQAVDATHWLWNSRSCEEVEAIWRAALTRAAERNGFLTFIWHPHVMGIDADRLALGARILEWVTRDDSFRPVSLRKLVEYHQAQLPDF
ncbi:MAG: polysaccharide deacetylase family protein [Pseudomonadales bacterium]|nr:polysaccharide deacetylase family protein [Pseudomonadales bacterium]